MKKPRLTEQQIAFALRQRASVKGDNPGQR
jgi:hypothetical protein